MPIDTRAERQSAAFLANYSCTPDVSVADSAADRASKGYNYSISGLGPIDPAGARRPMVGVLR